GGSSGRPSYTRTSFDAHRISSASLSDPSSAGGSGTRSRASCALAAGARRSRSDRNATARSITDTGRMRALAPAFNLRRPGDAASWRDGVGLCSRAVAPAPFDPASLPPGTVVAGKYELGPPIGFGDHSVVYSAVHRLLQRKAAVKVVA